MKISYNYCIIDSVIMMSSVFNKDLPHSCSYCVYGCASLFSGEILCKKHGVTAARDSCRSYRYDPLKRVPARVKLGDNYKPEDFSL